MTYEETVACATRHRIWLCKLARLVASWRRQVACAVCLAALLLPASAAVVVESLVLDGTVPVSIVEDTTVSNLSVTAQSHITVDSGVTLSVVNYVGNDILLQLHGGGTVAIENLQGDMGFIEANDSVTLRFTAETDTHGLASGAFFHVDASVAASLVTENRNGTNFVVRWNDVRGAAYPYAYNGDQDTQPYLVDNGARSHVDMGRYQSFPATGQGGYLDWSQRSTAIREVFLVLSDTEDAHSSQGVSGARPFLLGDSSSHDFHRGYSDFALFASNDGYASDYIKNGTITLNRETVPYTQPLPEGFSLVHVRTTGGTTAGTFSKDRNIRFGGQRIQEAIVFESLLDEGVSQELERRLYAKWLRRMNQISVHGTARLETVGPLSATWIFQSPNDCNTFVGDFDAGCSLMGRLSIPSGRLNVRSSSRMGDVVGEVSYDGKVGVYRLGGVDDYVKKGGGTAVMRALSATNITVVAGNLEVEMQSPALDTYFHVDASKSDTVVTSGATNGMPFVTYWRCLRSDYRRQASSSEGTRPWLRSGFQNGLPVIDFGSPKYVNKSYHGFDNGYGGYMPWNHTNNVIREVFVVYSDTEDWLEKNMNTPGCFILGSLKDRYDFHRANGVSTHALFHPSNSKDFVREGAVRIDGVPVQSPTTEVLPAGFHVIHVRTKNAATASASDFANDRGYIMGGQRLAEVLVYTNQTSDAQRDAVEAYLRNKWLGAQVAGCAYGTVQVAAGSTVTLPRQAAVDSVTGPGTVTAKDRVTVRNVSGGASFAGDVVLAEGATVAIRDFSALTVGGNLALPAIGTLVLDGGSPTENLAGETRTVMQADSVTASSLAGWTVSGSLTSRYCTALAVSGDTVTVTFSPSGTMILFR